MDDKNYKQQTGEGDRREREILTIPLKNNHPRSTRHFNPFFHRVLDSMIETRRPHRSCRRRTTSIPCYRLSQFLHQLVEALAIKSKLGAATGMGQFGVGHGGKLGTREMETVHGKGKGDLIAGQGSLGVDEVDAVGEDFGDRGFAGTGDAGYGDHCFVWEECKCQYIPYDGPSLGKKERGTKQKGS